MSTQHTTLAAHAASGRVPVDFHGTIVIGSRWALALAAAGRVVAPLGRLVDALIPGVVWVGLLVGVPAVLTGHAGSLGLSDTRVGYRPLHLVVAGVGLLVLGWIIADVIGFGRANRAAARIWAREPVAAAAPPDPITETSSSGIRESR